jgi:L-iditol 2-dehydrogenase
MRIARLQKPLVMEVEEMEAPHAGPEEVLLQVAYCGVCGTDVDAYVGKQPRGWTITYPFRMGHELSGTVLDVGAKVAGYRPGDRVVADGRLTCGHCYYCRRGLFSACQNAGYFSGGLAEYSAYPFQNLVKIPEGISLAEAALAEPLACVVNGQSKLNIPLGGVGLVIGDGPIGLMHSQLLQHRGMYVLLAGLLEHRLALARELGINAVVNARGQDVGQALRAASGGRGADVVIVATGGQAILEQAIDLAARRAQVLYFAAALKPQITLDLDLIHYKELQLIGSYDSTIAQYEQALALMQAGAVRAQPLISHRLPLQGVQHAFELAQKQEGVKVLVTHEGAGV